MSRADANGWMAIESESAPNNVFDVLAKRYDADLDTFLMVRFAGCVQVDGRVLYPLPSPPFGDTDRIDLLAHGYRPTHWRHIPKPPVQP